MAVLITLLTTRMQQLLACSTQSSMLLTSRLLKLMACYAVLMIPTKNGSDIAISTITFFSALTSSFCINFFLLNQLWKWPHHSFNHFRVLQQAFVSGSSVQDLKINYLESKPSFLERRCGLQRLSCWVSVTWVLCSNTNYCHGAKGVFWVLLLFHFKWTKDYTSITETNYPSPVCFFLMS